MRELTAAEMQQVNGGLGALDGASLIMTLSMWSPVTFAFGTPIAGALLGLHYISEN